MALIRLKLQTRVPARAPARAQEPGGSVRFTSLRNSYFPVRGVPLSLVVHGLLFSVLVFLRAPEDTRAEHRPPPRAEVIDSDQPRVVMYLPLIGGGTLGFVPPAPKAAKGAKAKAGVAPELPAPRPGGMSYPGRQEIFSDPPDPTNRIQTLEQPDLDHPPILPPPLALPNMVQIAQVRVEPPPEPQAPAKGPEEVPPADPPPARPPGQIQPPAPPPVKPPEVKPQAPPGPPAPADPPQAPRPVDPPAPPQPPAVVPPVLVPPDEPVLPPVAPMTIPVPAPAAVIEIPRAKLPPLVPPPPEAPPPVAPPPVVAKPAVTEAPKAAVPAAPKVAAPREVPGPAEPKPGRKAREAPEGGSDRKDLLALTPMPAPLGDTIVVPPGEARGRFAISPDANLAGSDAAPGPKSGPRAPDLPGGTAAKSAPEKTAPPAPDRTPEPARAQAETAPTPAVVNIGSIGRRGDGAGGAKSAKPAPTPKPGVGAGRTGSPGGGALAGSGTGAGSGSGSGPGRKRPFSGITIVGGSYDPGVASDRAAVVQARRPVQTEYGLTVISTETSGGGLPFTGIFAGAQIYTVYLDMRRDESDPAPSWTLEFALEKGASGPAAPPGAPAGGGEGLILPFPVTKETPSWPPELVSRYPGRMAIVYAVVNTEGKLEQIEVKDSPDPLLREPLITALGRWVFRAAQLQGSAVPIRLLMGIPLRAPR